MEVEDRTTGVTRGTLVVERIVELEVDDDNELLLLLEVLEDVGVVEVEEEEELRSVGKVDV